MPADPPRLAPTAVPLPATGSEDLDRSQPPDTPETRRRWRRPSVVACGPGACGDAAAGLVVRGVQQRRRHAHRSHEGSDPQSPPDVVPATGADGLEPRDRRCPGRVRIHGGFLPLGTDRLPGWRPLLLPLRLNRTAPCTAPARRDIHSGHRVGCCFGRVGTSHCPPVLCSAAAELPLDASEAVRRGLDATPGERPRLCPRY